MPHPLNELLKMFPSEIFRTPATYVGQVRNARPKVLDPRYFHFEDDLNGKHILVLEDSWVTGKSSVAVAAKARLSGAAKVSILSIGRYFNTEWPVNRLWLEKGVAKTPYDPFFCPVTRGKCPPPT
ncbi:hypothetical protein GCM10009715_40210 [Paeniglutamicibacter psychrophenolicus]|uniref:Phosphoribosyltransferase n=1 Tax=Paeniglutamicibacter psychrophenolicus TaxID=257454 RepID=A0ABS4WAS8_9MICC|nr:phosphoribosyltransferase [Paeniglutamicibacter psychrophenolicus]MBP2373291.1 hypothetical protein [Paeniglutamicibacter psychrophenolicus]